MPCVRNWAISSCIILAPTLQLLDYDLSHTSEFEISTIRLVGFYVSLLLLTDSDKTYLCSVKYVWPM